MNRFSTARQATDAGDVVRENHNIVCLACYRSARSTTQPLSADRCKSVSCMQRRHQSAGNRPAGLLLFHGNSSKASELRDDR